MGDAAYKQRHREQELCISCARKAEYKIYCLLHYWKQLICARNSRHRIRVRDRQVQDDRRKRYKEGGMCRDCGKPLREFEGIVCTNCKTGRVLV